MFEAIDVWELPDSSDDEQPRLKASDCWELPDSSDDEEPRGKRRPPGIFGKKQARVWRDKILQRSGMMPRQPAGGAGVRQWEERLNQKKIIK